MNLGNAYLPVSEEDSMHLKRQFWNLFYFECSVCHSVNWCHVVLKKSSPKFSKQFGDIFVASKVESLLARLFCKTVNFACVLLSDLRLVWEYYGYSIRGFCLYILWYLSRNLLMPLVRCPYLSENVHEHVATGIEYDMCRHGRHVRSHGYPMG